MSQNNQLANRSDWVQTVAYKLRLARLDKTQRILMDNNIIDNNGFLTENGAIAYLDYLWQNNPDHQQEIATAVERINAEKKETEKKG